MSRTESVASISEITPEDVSPASRPIHKPIVQAVGKLANDLGSDAGCQADSTRLLSELLSSIKADSTLEQQLVRFLIEKTSLDEGRVKQALHTLASRYATSSAPVGVGGTQPVSAAAANADDVPQVEKILMSEDGRSYVNTLIEESKQGDGGIRRGRQPEIVGDNNVVSPNPGGLAEPDSNGVDQNHSNAAIPLRTQVYDTSPQVDATSPQVDATSPSNLPLPSSGATAASGTAASGTAASGTAASGTAASGTAASSTAASGTGPTRAPMPTFTPESFLDDFDNSLNTIQTRLNTVKEARAEILSKHEHLSQEWNRRAEELSLIRSVKAIAGRAAAGPWAAVAGKIWRQIASQGGFKRQISERILRVPTYAEINETGKMLGEVEARLKGNIEEIVKAVENSSNGDNEKTQSGVKDREDNPRALEAKLEQVAKLKVCVANALDHLECIEGFDRWAKSDRSKGSFPLAMKWMGLREGGSNNASFVEALRHSDVGAGNHALDRAMSLRVGMAGLLSQIRPGEHSRTDVAVMADRLKNNYKDEKKRVMDLFQKKDSNEQTQTATENLASLAAMNLIAAGYNPVTMERDAPRLEYKVENKGFSSLKKATYIGRSGVTVRGAAKHVKPRLNALKEVQESIRKALYPHNEPANVDPALTSKENLQEFASIMIASMPQDFLVTKPELVRHLTDLSKQCSEKESKFSELKAGFLKVHEEVAEALKSYKPNEALVLAGVSDEAVIRVHRRSSFFKAAAAIGRSFMKLIGRPIVNLAKAIQNLWVNGVAVERFKEEMFYKQGDADRLATVIAVNEALGETDPERLGLITKFMRGGLERIDLSGFLPDKLSVESLLAIKKHAVDSWKKVNKNVPIPHDLVLLDQSVFSAGAVNKSAPQSGVSPVLPPPVHNQNPAPQPVNSRGGGGINRSASERVGSG